MFSAFALMFISTFLLLLSAIADLCCQKGQHENAGLSV
ncbi:hypothetical protein BN129_1341 [Cronobacter sakazakii 701]|nr:hypothetical protein BN129_1341 [Cronobacter sakazakii 701]